MFVQTFSERESLRGSDSHSNRRSPPRRTMSATRGSMRARIMMSLRACTSGQRGPDDDDDLPNDVQVGDISSTEGRHNSSRLEHTLSQQSSMTSSSSHSASPAISSRSPSRLSLIRNSARNSRVSSILSPTTCAICLENMKAGEGQALFTSECNHTFHFACIASNVRHGNLLCPNCRAKWKEVPWQAPADVPVNDSLHRVTSRLSGNFSRLRISQHVSQHVPGARSSPGSSPPHLAQEVVGDVEEEQRRVDPVLRILDESIANARGGVRGLGPREPDVFDDDEALGSPSSTRAGNGNEEQRERTTNSGEAQEERPCHTWSQVSEDGAKLEQEERSVVPEISVRGYTEVNAVPAKDECETFTVLVNLKSALCNTTTRDENGAEEARRIQLNPKLLLDPSNRAPLDLVTVLDVSGSMKGTKLVLLKRAMDFVISNLSPSDRLSVVSFSSVAQRVSPLKRMVEDGRQFTLGCVASLVSTGGTNIAEGLRKGAKVLEERRMRNPVASIMLLSDGQDTTVMSNRSQFSSFSSHSGGGVDSRRRLLPRSVRHALRHGQNPQIPVHTFGFGTDHDAATMHSISDASGGTFSFIQSESAVQDAFAQCIGGLLSVVVQDAHLAISAGAPGVQIKSIQAGSYATSITDGGRQSLVRIGDLYAEEERNILVDLKVPSADLRHSSDGSVSIAPIMELLRVSCSFRDPVINSVTQTPITDISIARPEFVDISSQTVRLEVDRQRNRVHVAESIVQAGALADAGDISSAQEILSTAKEALLMSPAFQAADQLCLDLETELVSIQTRMANRQMYERSGRAYILSAQSSHLRQRATTRGDFSENHSREYQTPSMADMISRSQILQLPRAETASTSGSPSREARRSRHSGRVQVPSSSPSRMLLLRG